MNPPSLVYSKYFQYYNFYSSKTGDSKSIELLATCVFSKLKHCICRDLFNWTGSWITDFFYYLSVLNNNFEEIMNCKNVIGKL